MVGSTGKKKEIKKKIIHCMQLNCREGHLNFF